MYDRPLPRGIFKANFLLILLIYHVALISVSFGLSTFIITTLIFRLIVYCRSKQAKVSLVQTVGHSIDIKHLVSRLVSYAYFVSTYTANDAIIRVPLIFFTRVL